MALSMDSLAVSIANGLSMKSLNLQKALFIAFTFAFAQALMPLFGFYAGLFVKDWLEAWDHWIAFCLLLFVGTKMLYESFLEEGESDLRFAIWPVIIQGVATSLDALIIGLGFALLHYAILQPVLIIGFVTLTFSFAGLYIGRIIGARFERRITGIGGIVLIAIGVKILIEHLFFC